MKIRNLLITGLLTASMAACSNSGKTEAEVAETTEIEILSVDDVLADLQAREGDTITVTGTCSHICSRCGNKAFLQGTDTASFLICIADTTLEGGVFAPDSKGKNMTVYGIVTPIKATVADLEERAAAQAESADCCTANAATSAAAQLDSLNRQIAAGGDSTLTVGYYINTSSYGITE
ncbi:MAG: hypothetical protein NC405_00490 [Odoribacter sp.]|nr:hypothetical protein [Odoribacter sp.]